MAADSEKRNRAEAFADYVEAEFRKIGAVGDFFCVKQRERWREHAVHAYEGTASEPYADSKSEQQEENTSADAASS